MAGMGGGLHDTSGETKHQRASLENSSVQFPRIDLLSQKKYAIVSTRLNVLGEKMEGCKEKGNKFTKY